MARSFYTVSFIDRSGVAQVSRFFNTLHAARKWSAFILGLGNVTEVSIHRGQAGGELIERRAA